MKMSTSEIVMQAGVVGFHRIICMQLPLLQLLGLVRTILQGMVYFVGKHLRLYRITTLPDAY